MLVLVEAFWYKGVVFKVVYAKTPSVRIDRTGSCLWMSDDVVMDASLALLIVCRSVVT